VRNGVAKFELTTNSIEIRPIGGSGTVKELRLLGMDLPPVPAEFSVPCGQGPVVTMDGFTYQTSVSGTLADYVAHRPMRFETCADSAGGLDLPSGRHEVRTDRAASFVVQDLWLLTGSSPHAATRPVTVTRWDTSHRAVRVGAGAAAVLSVPENANSGWVATLNGRTLPKVRVDGWQQAWVVPAGSGGTVTLEFTPDGQYRQGLLTGGLTAMALVLSLLIPVRRRATISVRAGGERWVPVALVVLLGLLGGMLPIILLIACLLVRTLWPPAPRWLAVGGAGLACVVAVSGRVLRNGQEWAHGTAAQALLLLAVAAVVTGCLDWFAARPKLDQRARAHEHPVGDDGGGDDPRELAVQPAGHEHDLDHDGTPDEQR
jgi:arabinofuranan 3-O-arabinosyltransferase